MTRPRSQHRKRVLQIGRRTLGQFFRLLPSEEANKVFGYLLARYLKRFGVQLHAAVFMGNHYHLLVSADEPTISAFAQALNSQIARYLNACHGIAHVPLWDNRPPLECECVDPESAFDDVIYLALNPVEALIVRHPRFYPGVIILPTDWGRELSFDPPTDFFRFADRGEGPITITPTPPPGFEDQPLDKLIDYAMHKIEMGARKIRRGGTKFWGLDSVGIWDCPKSLRARRLGGSLKGRFPSSRLETLKNDGAKTSLFDSAPLFQAADKELLPRAHERENRFRETYAACREAEANGESDVIYPEGTYAVRVRNHARAEPLVDRGWYPLLNYG